MLQATLSYCVLLDPLSFAQDGFFTAEVEVGECDVVQTLVVALVIAILDEGPDLTLQIPGKVVVFQQNAVFHGLIPAFNFALSMWVKRCPTYVLHALPFQPFRQIARDVTRAVITEQSRLVAYDSLVAT